MSTVYITKYALTQGIYSADAEVDGEMAIVRPKNSLSLTQYFHRNEWHETRRQAEKEAERMRGKKLTALMRTIRKLETMTFSESGE